MLGLLICQEDNKIFNIGDYIQSIAVEKFYDSDYCLVNRENLDTFQCKEKVFTVMNGWFLHHPENWPPSSDINPLFVSFHITPNAEKRLLSIEGINYLKKFEPIGTRDLSTKQLLDKYDIKSYFSGCLTLTIGNFVKKKKSNHQILFVDPYFEQGNNRTAPIVKIVYKAFILYIKHYSKINRIASRFNCDKCLRISPPLKRIGQSLLAASFYESYRLAFQDELLQNATYISHSVFSSEYPTVHDKMNYGKDLIENYSYAKLVITSRIHCALPCLSMGVPVIFVTSKALSEGRVRSANRFDGLLNLLNVIEWSPTGLRGLSESMKRLFDNGGKISNDTVIKNKKDYLELSDNLTKVVSGFVCQAKKSCKISEI